MSSAYLRLLVVLIVIGCVTALIVWLIQSFLDLYQTVQSSPLLGSILIGVFIVLLVVFLAATLYYLVLFRRPEAHSQAQPLERPSLPETAAEKVTVAQQNLAQIEHQAAQIQDEVARQALTERSAEVARNLKQPSLKVVVFGTGSAGKTSLVNALLGQPIGTVGVNLGTTTTSALYRWPLPGIPEPVEIVDAPGILEIGAAGIARELEARDRAKAADLIIVVTDGDLRQSEYEPLMELIQLGKRSILVLNKADQYTESEQQMIQARLRDRVQSVIAFEDVLIAAAHPAPIESGGQSIQPTPQVAAIRDRVQAILYTEGPALALDNALLQSQQLGEEARRIIAKQLEQRAEQVIDRFQWIVTGVVFANPIPAVDLLAIAAINAQMVVEIGAIYSCKMSLKQGRELAYSLAKTLASVGLVEGAIQLSTSLLSTLAEVSIVGFLVTAPIQAISAGYLTHIAGRSFIEYFSHNQSWGDQGMQAVVTSQAKQVQASGWLTSFTQTAMKTIFQPQLFAKNSQNDQESSHQMDRNHRSNSN